MRKTDKGFFESNAENGKISADKAVRFKKKGSTVSISGKALLTEDPEVSQEDIVAVNDVFILGFRDYVNSEGVVVGIDLDKAVAAYSALSVIVSASKN